MVKVGLALPGGGEDAGAADEQVVDRVHPAVGVDDAGRRVGAHPRRAHVLAPVDQAVARIDLGQLRVVAQQPAPEPEPPEILLGDVGAEGDRRHRAASGSRPRSAASPAGAG